MTQNLQINLFAYKNRKQITVSNTIFIFHTYFIFLTFILDTNSKKVHIPLHLLSYLEKNAVLRESVAEMRVPHNGPQVHRALVSITSPAALSFSRSSKRSHCKFALWLADIGCKAKFNCWTQRMSSTSPMSHISPQTVRNKWCATCDPCAVLNHDNHAARSPWRIALLSSMVAQTETLAKTRANLLERQACSTTGF